MCQTNCSLGSFVSFIFEKSVSLNATETYLQIKHIKSLACRIFFFLYGGQIAALEADKLQEIMSSLLI